MPRSKLEVLDDAQKFYVAKKYGSLPEPLTGESLAKDQAFCDFYKKYETAYQYYSTAGYPEGLIQSHMSGIDFNRPVEIVIIPSGQKHTQTQVAWGARGNYYSNSDTTPQMMGIAPQGKMFDPQFVPPHLKSSMDERINQLKTKMLSTLGHEPDLQKFDEVFPPLPEAAKKEKDTKVILATKAATTYQAEEEVRALKSTAKEIRDTWSVPGKEIHCIGGGMQLYVSPKENEKMKKIDLGAHDAPEQVRFISPS